MTKVERIRVFANQYPQVLHNGYTVSTTGDVNKLVVFNDETKAVDLYYWEQNIWSLRLSLEYKPFDISGLFPRMLTINSIGTLIAAEFINSSGRQSHVCIWYLSDSTWRYEGLINPKYIKSTFDIELQLDNLTTLKEKFECPKQHLK